MYAVTKDGWIGMLAKKVSHKTCNIDLTDMLAENAIVCLVENSNGI